LIKGKTAFQSPCLSSWRERRAKLAGSGRNCPYCPFHYWKRNNRYFLLDLK